MTQAIVLYAVLLSACLRPWPRPTEPPGLPPAGWERAARVAWVMLIGEGEAPVDGVRWVAPSGDPGCEDGIYDGDSCVFGLTFSCSEIYVVARDPRASGTSLTHELLHCALQRRYGNGNGKHDRPEWSSVPVINYTLWEMRL